MAFDYNFYLRENHLPHIWCPGCSHGIVAKGIIRAVHKMGWEKDDLVIVSGIGCASRLPGYVDANTLHTTHGRALAFALGIKIIKPYLKVIIVSGDGDALAIGGNHFLHACRRNIDINLIIFNNKVYGMTGGQTSPTTPFGSFTSTGPYGNVEHELDPVAVGVAAGATFVARTTAYHVMQMDKIFTQAFEHKGFSVVDVSCDCWTTYGRKNAMKNPVDMLDVYRKKCVKYEKYQELSDEEKKEHIPIGIFHRETRPEYVDELQLIKERAMKELKK